MGCMEGKDIKNDNSYSGGKNENGLVKSMTVTTADLVNHHSGKIEDYYSIIYPELGQGAFAKVCKVLHRETGIIRAVKIISKANASAEERERIINEVNILKTLVYINYSGSPKYFESFRVF